MDEAFSLRSAYEIVRRWGMRSLLCMALCQVGVGIALAQTGEQPDWQERTYVAPAPTPVSVALRSERDWSAFDGPQGGVAASEIPQPTAAPGGDSASLTEAAAGEKEPTLGEAPRDTRLLFLRQQSVLLKPCEWQMDIGFSYLYAENQYADVVSSTLTNTHIRRRLLTMPIELRYGLTDRVQLFINAPFGWANTQTYQLSDDRFSNEGGIGDTNVGASFLVHKSDGFSYSPDIVATFGLTAPTGKGDALLGILESPEITLGQGYWAGYWNILFIHQYDPVTVFYGFGSRHYVEKNVEGYDMRPGDQFTYQLGTGFAVNERITFSTTFFGSYITEPRINGQIVEGANQEPMYLRFALTVSRPQRICEPFVEVGMTEAAANSRVGITWTF